MGALVFLGYRQAYKLSASKQPAPVQHPSGVGCSAGLPDGTCSCAWRSQQGSHVYRWVRSLNQDCYQAVPELSLVCPAHMSVHGKPCTCITFMQCAGWLAKTLATVPSAFFEASVPVSHWAMKLCACTLVLPASALWPQLFLPPILCSCHAHMPTSYAGREDLLAGLPLCMPGCQVP